MFLNKVILGQYEDGSRAVPDLDMALELFINQILSSLNIKMNHSCPIKPCENVIKEGLVFRKGLVPNLSELIGR